VKIKLQKISEKSLLQLLAVAVGLLCGFAAVLLKQLIHYIQSGVSMVAGNEWSVLVYFICPGLGMLLSFLFVTYFVKEDISHGVTKVLRAISKNDCHINTSNTWTSILASSLTIGFGGSVGAEAPIVYTGAAIGSNIGRKAGLSYKSMTILLGCGAAAAIAGIFKAPLAGVLFTLEILLFNISMSSIVPVLISSVTATVVTYLLLGNDVPFANALEVFRMANIPYYLILGLFCGAMSIYFLYMTLKVEDTMRHVRSKWTRWITGSLLLGTMIVICPPLFGEGYTSLGFLLNNNAEMLTMGLFQNIGTERWSMVVFACGIILLKVIATALTNAGGGVGGTFGPTLVSGGIAGFIVARVINLSGIAVVPEPNFVLVGMAGMMAGVMQAPMTAIFLIAEITGGYELLIPLIIVSIVSFATMRTRESYSIYSKRLAAQGELLTHDNDKAVLTLLRTSDMVEKDFMTVNINGTLGDIVSAIPHTGRSFFPVLDDYDRLCGIIYLDDIRNIMFDSSMYDAIKVSKLMRSVPAFIYIDEKMESVVAKLDRTKAWNLPVVDDENKFLGFVSKSKLFTSYRDQLRELSHE